jgi:hypothetical protein
LKQNLRSDIPLIEMDAEINDPAFAERCARTLIELVRSAGGKKKIG